MDALEQLLQRGIQSQEGRLQQALLSASEAERIIHQLAPLSIEEVGSAKWHTQHEWIERLNLQAHYNAQTHSDEFVVELLVSLDKLHVLVHDLLVIEAWKEYVYPLLASHLVDRVDSVTAYLLLYHEVTVANLLQISLYHAHAAESLSEDYALEVADWCYRKLTALNTEGHKLAKQTERTTEELLRRTPQEEQEEKRREVEFSVMMCSLAILRYMTDALPRMPMGALSRVVSTNDTLMGLLPLLDRPPWVRTRAPVGPTAGRPVLEKWAGNRWAPVAPADRLKITQTDGQVWLAVTNLLVEPRCRAKYSLDEYRRERILGLRRHLNEFMFDQLPVLKDLQRVVDELALGMLPDQGAAGKGALILEAVPVIREQLLRGRNWRQVAEQAKKEHFGRAAAGLAAERMEALVKNLDFLCELEPEPVDSAAVVAADGADGTSTSSLTERHPPVKISTWRKVHGSGVYEAWCDFCMEVDQGRPPEPTEIAVAAAGTSGSGAQSVQGLRYRLRPLDIESTRPLPANGKAVVRWGSLTAEALLQLPELPTRTSEEGAAVLWVTIGLLAVDGIVLQVKLKKAPTPKERDRLAGVWYAYHPVAGALTVLKKAPGGKAEDAAAAAAGTGTAGATTAAVNLKSPQTNADAKSKAASRPLVQSLTSLPTTRTAAAAAGGHAPAASVAGSASAQALPPTTTLLPPAPAVGAAKAGAIDAAQGSSGVIRVQDGASGASALGGGAAVALGGGGVGVGGDQVQVARGGTSVMEALVKPAGAPLALAAAAAGGGTLTVSPTTSRVTAAAPEPVFKDFADGRLCNAPGASSLAAYEDEGAGLDDPE